MAGKLGFARLEALLESLGREVDLKESTLVCKQKIQNLTAAKNLTAADCGIVTLGTVGAAIAEDAGFTVNLPKPERGLWFKFVFVGTSIFNSTDSAIFVKSTSDGETAAAISVGSVTVNNMVPTNVVSGVKTLEFVENKATGGDYAYCVCDGTNWFFRAYGDDTGSITLSGT